MSESIKAISVELAISPSVLVSWHNLATERQAQRQPNRPSQTYRASQNER